jgi:hypothetical protein
MWGALGTTIRFGLVAAAIVLVATFGLEQLPSGIGADATPTPTPTPMPTPTLTPVESAFIGRWEGVDIGDQSRMTMQISIRNQVTIVFNDENATGGICNGKASSDFTDVMVGHLEGSEFVQDSATARCGSDPVSLGPITFALVNWENDDPNDDRLLDTTGQEFVRAADRR